MEEELSVGHAHSDSDGDAISGFINRGDYGRLIKGRILMRRL